MCLFCALSREAIAPLVHTAFYCLVRDRFPVSPGHMLIIPKRHIASLFELQNEEFADLQAALALARAEIEKEFAPSAYNIGVNDGPAAGQTILHMHVHLIPRYDGDRLDPRGGIRWLFPEKADYWTQGAQG